VALQDRRIVGLQFNVSERTKAVNLQFKDKLVRIERFKAPGKPYWTHPAWKHALSIKRTRELASSRVSVKLVISPRLTFNLSIRYKLVGDLPDGRPCRAEPK
jgi:hypothetical protein